MSQMDEATRDFLVESRENLDRLDTEMVTLEERPDDRQTLASIFRTIHTIKGTCGFLGFSKLESVTHVGESLLARLRDGKLVIDGAMTNALLAMVDAVRKMLEEIEQQGTEGAGDYTELISTLNALQGKSDAKGAAPAANVAKSAANEPLALAEPAPAVAASARAAEPAAAEKREHVEAAAETRSSGALADTNIRVDVGLLDRLMNLVGELVLARNQILQFTSRADDSVFAATTQRLNLVTTELQEGVMKTRMQPIGNVWSKFPRVVRDVAKTCGKQVALELEGNETELDKTIIEAIKDPLTHIVRNSIDHGIEKPDVRVANGKSREGRLRMRAFHEGGQVIIEISDDGAGISTERVKAKALERALITPEQAARMGERELINLIFLPGFSTAAAVTNVSGRGVGMDVVRTNIEKIGGTVDVQSQHGTGTTLRIKIPLTLAIIPALLVTTGGDRYAIPQVSLLELVRLESDQAKTAVEDVHGAPVYRLRGRLLPLVFLGRTLEVEAQRAALGTSAINIVVLQADDRQFGLVVDEINDTEEIVVKPLGKQLKGISSFAGATILGDGTVSLILDVLGLAQRCQVVGGGQHGARQSARDDAQARAEQNQTLLLFRVDQDRRLAIALSSVARLEEFAPDRVERAGESMVVQYRDEIMPLVSLREALGCAPAANDMRRATEPLQVVVCTRQGVRVGLVVDQILDITDVPFRLQRRSDERGILGSTVIQGRVTDVVDIDSLLTGCAPPRENTTREVRAADRVLVGAGSNS